MGEEGEIYWGRGLHTYICILQFCFKDIWPTYAELRWEFIYKKTVLKKKVNTKPHFQLRTKEKKKEICYWPCHQPSKQALRYFFFLLLSFINSHLCSVLQVWWALHVKVYMYVRIRKSLMISLDCDPLCITPPPSYLAIVPLTRQMWCLTLFSFLSLLFRSMTTFYYNVYGL